MKASLTVVAIGLMVGLGGCATKTPDCADSHPVSLLKQILHNQIEHMGTISEIGNLLPKEWVNDLVIEVDGIRILALDKNIDKYTCAAQIKITDTKAAKPTDDVAALGLIHQELSSEGVAVVYTIERMADNPKETRVEMHSSEQLQQSLIMLGAMRQTFGNSGAATMR